MSGKLKNFLEGLVVLAIILVLFQTFLEDLAVLMGWTWSVRRTLIITGFGFDLFFTLEFLSRFYAALSLGELREYMGRRRGWIDLIASVPLLILNSGPAVITLLAGAGVLFSVGGILNILKIVKTVRIARILRLLRVLKVFKQIKNIDSVMAQRHLMKITSMAITTLVLTLFGITLLAGIVGLPQTDTILMEEHAAAVQRFLMLEETAGPEVARADISSTQQDLLILKQGEETLFARHANDYFREHYGPGDYHYTGTGEYRFFFDLRRVQVLESRNNLMYFILVILLTFGLLFVYSPHFAMTVTDPIHVMRRGMTEKDYNFEVRIHDEFADDDVFRLARTYNEVFLPMKDLQNQDVESRPEDLELKMDDIKDLFS